MEHHKTNGKSVAFMQCYISWNKCFFLEFQRVNNSTCIFANTVGNLYLFTSSKLNNLPLQVSPGDHRLFAVENSTENSTKGPVLRIDRFTMDDESAQNYHENKGTHRSMFASAFVFMIILS